MFKLKKENDKRHMNYEPRATNHLRQLVVAMAVLGMVLIAPNFAYATIYFYYDAEDTAVDDSIPQHPQPSGNPQFCETCWGDPGPGIVKDTLSAPQGSRYWQWDVDANQTNASSSTTTVGTFPISVSMGETYYLACFSRFERIGGNDIWHEYDSHDKYLELYGSRNYFRFIIEFGQHACHEQNDDHHFTSWVNGPDAISPPCHSCFPQNAGGYNSTNTLQLNYEQWYGVVMKVKISDVEAGELGLWINGIQILNYTEIVTVENYTGISISSLMIGGTLAQPAYDCPAHYRQQDALILTDNWQDIIDGGYLSDPQTILGDLTGDSLINIQDIQACVNHILGMQDWGSAANVNGDEAVNVLDVQMIVNIVLEG